MHDINLALQWADRAMLLHEGRLLRHIPTAQLTTGDLSTLFGLRYRMLEGQDNQRWFQPEV